MNNLPVVSQQRKKECLESALFTLSLDSPFYASMLQELNISFDDRCPSAGIFYDKKKEEFNVLLNPHYFTTKDKLQRTAVLFHEILHFSHKHLIRNMDKITPENVKLHNIAMDMAINQYIQNLPKGCVNVDDYKYKDSRGMVQPYPKFRPYEEYYQLLEQDVQQEQKQPGSSQNKEVLDKYKEFDQHGDGTEIDLTEEQKQQMMKEMANVLKRTIEKSTYGHTIVPDHIKDLLEDLNQRVKGLDYKKILREAIKRTVSVQDRKSTWKKPNKRYSVFAPGTRVGDLPFIANFIDSSGSISHTELNQALELVNGFLKTGAKRCMLGFWHTSLYRVQKFKYKQDILKDMIQSGGTDVSCVMEYIAKHRPDLSIVYTDGYYDKSDVKVKGNDIIWIITKGGNKNHPMCHIGKTLMLEDILKGV